MELSLQSRAPFESASSSKSAPDPAISFYDFYLKSSSRYSPVRILPASSSKKCSGLDNLFDYFYVKSSSCYSPAHFVDHFLRSSTETLLRQPRPPLYTKKCRASRPRVSSSLISRVPDLSRFPTTYIMMWLPCLATVSCAFCRPHLPKSAPDPTLFLTIFM